MNIKTNQHKPLAFTKTIIPNLPPPPQIMIYYFQTKSILNKQCVKIFIF
jgi:hypothetical protein